MATASHSEEFVVHSAANMTDVNRRQVLKLAGSAAIALTTLGKACHVLATEGSSALAWERLLEICHSLSKVQFEDGWDQAAYTKKVRYLLERLQLDDQTVQALIKQYRNTDPIFPEISAMHKEQQFMVAMLTFEPGERIGLHDHPDMTGVILCTRGEVAVTHYDKLAETSDAGNALLREERHIVMSAGNSVSLTADKGNIHTLEANRFTRMIDIFTPPYDADRIERSRYYRKNSEPYRGRAGVFEAEETRQRT